MRWPAVPNPPRPPYLALAAFTVAGVVVFLAFVAVSCAAVLTVAALIGAI